MTRAYLKTNLTHKKGIYQITNLQNQKYYIGSSVSISKRWWEHKKFLRLGIHSNSHLQASWKKYGEDRFRFEILELLPDETSPSDVLKLEQTYLDKNFGKPECYNQSPSASKPDSEANKIPIRQLTKKTREFIKEWPSTVDATRELNGDPKYENGIRLACKGKRTSALGYKWEYADEKLRNMFVPRNTPHGGHAKRSVVKVDPQTQKVLEEYSSLVDAAEKNNINSYVYVLGVCSGRRKTAGSMVFRYKDQITPPITNSSMVLEDVAASGKIPSCLICGCQNFISLKSLATHIQFSHKMSSEEYTVKYLFGGQTPKCKVTDCPEPVRYVAFSFKPYCGVHKKLAESEAGKRGGRAKRSIHGGGLSAGDLSVLTSYDELTYGSARSVLSCARYGKLTKSLFVNVLSRKEKESLVEPVFSFFRTHGFPFPRYSPEELVEDWEKLRDSPTSVPLAIQTTTTNPLLSSSPIIQNKNTRGAKLARHFNGEQFYSVSERKTPSMLKAFGDDVVLRKVIENRLGISYKENFNIHGAMIRQGFRSARLCSTTSVFNPFVAKVIYENFPRSTSLPSSNSNLPSSSPVVVLDYSSGFGHRLLGALSSGQVGKYIGCDPWLATVQGNRKMMEFLQVDPERYSLHAVGSENFCPPDLRGSVDFAFSSPPYFDKEIYDGGSSSQAYSLLSEKDHSRPYDKFINTWWRQTLENISRMLTPGGVLALNMVETLGPLAILEDMTRVAESVGFEEFARWNLRMSVGHMAKKKTKKNSKSEPIVFFRRKNIS